MNRLSFLKTIGTGIAAAVIAPKIIASEFAKTTEPVIAKGWRYETNYNTEYGHYEESFEIRDTRVCMYDMMLNKDEKVYVVTHLDQNRIGLTAVLAETEPNELTVDKNYLYEYFVLIGSVFSEGKGLPT